jgi:hypothetical protein
VKILMHLAPDQALLDAAELARYVSNPYHRPPGSPMGQPIKRPYPHASKCPPTWELGAATRALKEAIRAGWISPAGAAGFLKRFGTKTWKLFIKLFSPTGRAANIMLTRSKAATSGQRDCDGRGGRISGELATGAAGADRLPFAR